MSKIELVVGDPAEIPNDHAINPNKGADDHVDQNKPGDKSGDDSKDDKPVDDSSGSDDFSEGDVIEIDGANYTVNATGDVVDDKGVVFKTKAELAALLAANNDTTDDALNADVVPQIFTELTTEIGYTPLGEDGKPISYTNDAAGIKQYVKDTLAQYPKAIAAEEVNKFFENNKDIYKAYMHKLRTGSIEGFEATPNWEDFDLDAATEEELTALFVAYRKSLGDDKETIDELLAAAKGNKSLAKKAASAKDYFVKKDKDERANAKAIEEANIAKARKEAEEYSAAINNTITKGVIKIDDQEYVIPEVIKVVKDGTIKQYSRKDFAEYIFTPKQFTIGDEKVTATQYQYDLHVQQSKRTHNHDVYDAYLTFTGGNVDQLAKRTLANEKHKDVKRKLSTTTKVNPGGGGGKVVLPVQ